MTKNKPFTHTYIYIKYAGPTVIYQKYIWNIGCLIYAYNAHKIRCVDKSKHKIDFLDKSGQIMNLFCLNLVIIMLNFHVFCRSPPHSWNVRPVASFKEADERPSSGGAEPAENRSSAVCHGEGHGPGDMS